MKRLLLLSFFLLFQIDGRHQAEPVHFFIVIATYHNREWCIENIQSVVKQNYPHWHAYITIDGSPQEDDGTGDLLRDYKNEHSDVAHKITIHHNNKRLYALENIYNAVHACHDDRWVVVILDGDDLLFDEQVLERLAQEYQDSQAWMTYGQFVFWPDGQRGTCEPFPSHIIEQRLFRKYRWVSSHLRSFYAWLFKLIAKKDLMYKGEFLKVAADVAIMYPMLEMAADGHIRFITDPLYLYRVHCNNDCAIDSGFVVHMTEYIRSLKCYEPLPDFSKQHEKITTYRKLFPKKGTSV